VEPEIIGVGCPFCMTMLEDGVKHYSAEENVKVLDVAEIVALAMEPKPVTADPVTQPSMV
jgi:Fe-S oxidoreductase